MAHESLDATIAISDDVLRPLAKPLTDGRRRDGWIDNLPGSKPSYARSCRLRPDLLLPLTPFFPRACYIRNWLDGNSSNATSQWIEIQAFGR